VRGSICLAALLCSACTGPPGEVVPLVPTPEQRMLVFPLVSRPDAPADPGPPVGFVGPNSGCPKLRVFADAEDLCERGILPLHPFGHCARLPRSDEVDDELVVRAKRVRVAALGGSAELFVKGYIGSGDSENVTVYLALRGVNGYVLLATVADHNSQGNDVPSFERFVGDATSVEVRTVQEWWNLDDDALTFSEFRRNTARCSVSDDSGIRCDGKCPELAIADVRPALNCAKLAGFDWSQLPTGDDASEDWGGRFDDDQLAIARHWLGVGDGADYEPRRVREVEVEGRTLTILETDPGRWALLHGQVPLVASEREIRVGLGPGGVFVSSESAGERRLQRLHIATHELEPIIPGHCG
jgi:hypothetical protein